MSPLTRFFPKKLLLSSGILLMLLSQSAISQENNSVTFEWKPVEFAVQYELQIKSKDDSQYTSAYVGTNLVGDKEQATISNLVDGEYLVIVRGCIDEAGTIECEGVSEFSEPLAFSAPISSEVIRRVIFIHTDLLGSPAAETEAK